MSSKNHEESGLDSVTVSYELPFHHILREMGLSGESKHSDPTYLQRYSKSHYMPNLSSNLSYHVIDYDTNDVIEEINSRFCLPIPKVCNNNMWYKVKDVPL